MIAATRETASQPGFPQDRWGVASKMRTRPPPQKGVVVLAKRSPTYSLSLSFLVLLPRTGDPTTNFPLGNSKPGAHTGAARTQPENLLPRPGPRMLLGPLQRTAGLWEKCVA